MNKVDTPFKDKVVSPPSFTIKPTLGNNPKSLPNSSDAGVSGTVRAKELPVNTLKFGE